MTVSGCPELRLMGAERSGLQEFMWGLLPVKPACRCACQPA